MATQGRQCGMTRGRRLGLDELMIVNPTSAGSGVCCFLGDDGTLYRLQCLPPKRSISASRLRDEQRVARGRFFLGEDGTVYEVVK